MYQIKKIKLSLILFIIFLLISSLFVFIREKNLHEPIDGHQKPAKSEQPDRQSPVTSKPVFNKQLHAIDDPESIWVIVNKTRPLSPIAYTPSDLVDVGNGQFMRQAAAATLQKMISAAVTENLDIQPLSGYRSYQMQQTVYAREVATYGQTVADTQSAKPGYSEHQTGLSIDVGGGGCGIEDCFGDTPAGKWVAANAYKYGFIIRYPEGKDSVTGYRYEPWHLRYVGTELAAEMKKQNITTLEEFFNL